MLLPGRGEIGRLHSDRGSQQAEQRKKEPAALTRSADDEKPFPKPIRDGLLPPVTLAPDTTVRAEIAALGPLEFYRQQLAANDAAIRSPALDNGREIVAARALAHTHLVAVWAEEEQQKFGYQAPFAVVALGGTGRAEVTPRSDLDFALLFEEPVEGNRFLAELQRQVLHTAEFAQRFGFAFEPLPFSLEDAVNLEEKQLNAFLDLRPVHDPLDLGSRFRERIRQTYDPFEHFQHVYNVWRDRWEKSAAESENLERFDIKNAGLRVFLAGVWAQAGRGFLHSQDIYDTLTDRRDLDAYYLLLRLRCFIHNRRTTRSRPTATGDHAEDLLGFDDFLSFGELAGPEVDARARFEFATDVRARLLAARRRVAQFTHGVIERELKTGREHRPGSPIVHGPGGLQHIMSHECVTPTEKSRAALGLLLVSQRYGVAIDRSDLDSTFRNAGDWLTPVPELAELFYEARGSLSASFAFLSQIDQAEARLFPGYARFEASLDNRVLAERRSLRSAFEREKLRTLESYLLEGQAALATAMPGSDPTDPTRTVSVALETALLDRNHLAGVKLALKTKRLPLTPEDLEVREDVTRELHERFASGFSEVPLQVYYPQYFGECGFTAETLDLARFLVAHRKAFKTSAVAALNDQRRVNEFVSLCGTEMRLRALFVFTNADRAFWGSDRDDPALWFNIRELYYKARLQFRPTRDLTRSISSAGYSRDELPILQDFGEDFFSGVYRPQANRFGAHLVRLAQEPGFDQPKAAVIHEGTSTILAVAARDFRGLAACITGALWHLGIQLRQAHLFSAARYGLAFDFFHLGVRGKPVGSELARAVEQAIREKRHIGAEDAASLPRLAERLTIEEWHPGLLWLRAETSGDVGALIYVLTFLVFRHLEGNVFGLSAHTGKTGAWASVYHSLPPYRSIEDARAILRETS